MSSADDLIRSWKARETKTFDDPIGALARSSEEVIWVDRIARWGGLDTSFPEVHLLAYVDLDGQAGRRGLFPLCIGDKRPGSMFVSDMKPGDRWCPRCYGIVMEHGGPEAMLDIVPDDPRM